VQQVDFSWPTELLEHGSQQFPIYMFSNAARASRSLLGEAEVVKDIFGITLAMQLDSQRRPLIRKSVVVEGYLG
jgi:hypothetical protein